MIGPDGQPQGSCLPLDARIAVLEENFRESRADRLRTNENLERIDHTLIAVVAGNMAILEKMTHGTGRMDDLEKRVGDLEDDKLRRDTEHRAATRHAAWAWTGFVGLGAAIGWLSTQSHAIMQLLGQKP